MSTEVDLSFPGSLVLRAAGGASCCLAVALAGVAPTPILVKKWLKIVDSMSLRD